MGYHSLGISLCRSLTGLALETQELRKQQLLMVSSFNTLVFRNNFKTTDPFRGDCVTLPLPELLQRLDSHTLGISAGAFELGVAHYY